MDLNFSSLLFKVSWLIKNHRNLESSLFYVKTQKGTDMQTYFCFVTSSVRKQEHGNLKTIKNFFCMYAISDLQEVLEIFGDFAKGINGIQWVHLMIFYIYDTCIRVSDQFVAYIFSSVFW